MRFLVGLISVSNRGIFSQAAGYLLKCYCDLVPPEINKLLPDKLRSGVKPRLRSFTGYGEKQEIFEHFVLACEHGENKIKVSVESRLKNFVEHKARISEYNNRRSYLKSKNSGSLKVAIFTGISDNYDSIKLPATLNANIDYVLFSDRPVADTGVYRVRPMPYLDNDPTRTVRFVKTHPHLLLKDYDIAIWIDSNIMILGDMSPFIKEFINSGKAVGTNLHPYRNNIYEEAKACIKNKRDKPGLIKKQCKYYKRQKYAHDDLAETNMMMFDLRDERTGRLLDLWWSEMDRNSKRDQLSFNYCADSLEIDWHRLTERSACLRDRPEFALVKHDRGRGPAQKLINAFAPQVVDPYAGPCFADHRELRIEAQKKRNIDVIVCVHNALDDVKLCLNSVINKRRGENQKLILIDDGSDWDTADYLRQFANGKDWVALQRNQSAVGFTFAANQGLRASSGELAILLNSDTIVTDGWAEKMADALFSTPGAGIVGPMSNAASHQSLPNCESTGDQTAINPIPEGITAEDMNKHCERWTTLGLLPLVPLVHGFCIGIAREVINRIGLLDENGFPGGYGAENDYCFRATESGMQLVIAGHTYIFHAKSKSYAESKRVGLMRLGDKALQKKYGRERIGRAVSSMRNNPFLMKMRKQAAELYAETNAA